MSVLFVYNCNPLATVPDQNACGAGLLREDLFTVVFEQVMTDTAAYADVILPATTFLEHYDIAKGYGAYHLQLVQPVIDAGRRSRGRITKCFASSACASDSPTPTTTSAKPARCWTSLPRLPEPLAAALARGRPAPGPAGGRPDSVRRRASEDAGRPRAPVSRGARVDTRPVSRTSPIRRPPLTRSA